MPALTGPVVDQARIIDAPTKAKLEGLLREANNRGKIQLQILTMNSLQGQTIEQASIQIVDRWKLGTKEKDNGVLFLIVPAEKQMRIEVGQGLEGDIPDVIAKRIIADIVTPYFRQGFYSEGIAAGSIEIIRGVDPEMAGAPSQMRAPKKKQLGPGWVFLIFLTIFILRFILGGGTGRSYGGGYGRSSGGWSGGGGGGGWSGGGGGFSGGGSSGRW